MTNKRVEITKDFGGTEELHNLTIKTGNKILLANFDIKPSELKVKQKEKNHKVAND